MSNRFYSFYKSAVLSVLLFLTAWAAEAACFSREQLYFLQTSSLEEIQTFFKAEGWELAEPTSAAEGATGFGFKKLVFTKNGNERAVVYTSSTEGNLIHLKVEDACFQTISSTEFGQLNRKLLVEQQKVTKEYREANQIVQLVEYAWSEVTNPEILIFNEALRSQVKILGQSGPWASPKAGTSNPSSSGKAGKGEVYDVVETLPIPSGGMAGWSAYLSANLGYPTTARRKDIEGTVIVAFVVNTDGTVSDFELLRGIGGGCNEEALRIVKGSPKWTPGMKDGKAVRTRMRLPIKFKLGEPDPSGDSTKVALPTAAALAATDGREANQQDTVYGSDEVDTPPSPIGGTAAWNRHLSESLTYPMSARMRGIQGTVWVSFIVNTDGGIEDIALVQGIGGGCDEEAMRIVKSSPRWTPGMINGKAVRTRMKIPTSFRLG